MLIFKFYEIKWLCAFTKYTQKFIIKPQSISMIDSFSPLDMKRKKLNLG